MSEREKIIGRIRDALRTPVPAAAHGSHAPAPHAPGQQQPSDWLPLVGTSFEEKVTLFEVNSIDLKTDFRLLDSLDDLSAALREIADADSWTKVGCHGGALTDRACNELSLQQVSTDGGYEVRDLESCDAGITECEALVAQTGTVLVSTRQSGGRALSVLPPHHVVLARREQLLPDLQAAFDFVSSKYAGSFPSMFSLITGPSRTGDIERILVLGAHGPKKLTVLCV